MEHIKRRYTERIDFRVTPNQKKQIEEKAKSAVLSDSEYIRQAVLGVTIVGGDIRHEIRELINEINKIGVNINQIARRHNSNLYSVEDKKALFSDMSQLEELVSNYINRIGGKT